MRAGERVLQRSAARILRSSSLLMWSSRAFQRCEITTRHFHQRGSSERLGSGARVGPAPSAARPPYG
eukprot:6015130-Lingulodinium_polyedra.AAC.1